MHRPIALLVHQNWLLCPVIDCSVQKTFKCLTTRCLHIDLLCSMGTNFFLLVLQLFLPRRGKPYEILCDTGANFHRGEQELWEASAALEPSLTPNSKNVVAGRSAKCWLTIWSSSLHSLPNPLLDQKWHTSTLDLLIEHHSGQLMECYAKIHSSKVNIM